MKKSTSFLVFFILIVFSFQPVKATIITVDNSQPRIGQFSSIQEAHDAANSGDTIMVYPSYALYDSIVCSKRIILIGAGFKSSQTGLKTTVIKEKVRFNPGSDGSVITGFGDNFSIVVDADNISIIKNRFDRIVILDDHFGTAIIQNYIYSNSGSYIIDVKSNNEIFVSNNIVVNIPNYSNGIKADTESNTSFINNNVFYLPNYGSVTLKVDNSNSTIQNNIIIGYAMYVSNYGFFHNINLNPERNSYEIDNIFVKRGEFDFHLKPESAAIGAGLNGVDLGAYGGDTPFDDNGYPAIPSIYYLDVPSAGSQKEGINVTIKAKSNN